MNSVKSFVSYINKAIMELKAHDGGDAPGFSNQGFDHDISDDEFGIWACLRVKIWPELGCCGHGYV